MSNQFYMPSQATPQSFEELRRYTQYELDRIEKGFVKVSAFAGSAGGTGSGSFGWNVDGGLANSVYLPSQVVDCGASATIPPNNAFDGGPASG